MVKINKKVLKKMYVRNIFNETYNEELLRIIDGTKKNIIISSGKGIGKEIKAIIEIYSSLINKKFYFYEFSKDKIFISLSPITNKSQLRRKLLKDHIFTGEILRIPSCCTKFFNDNYKSGKESCYSYFPALIYLQSVHDVIDPFKISISQGTVTTNIGYIPCSYKCKDSLKYLERIKAKTEETNKFWSALK